MSMDTTYQPKPPSITDIDARPVGELKHELVACLRHAYNKRVPCSKGHDRRGQIPDMLSLHVRSPGIEDRQFPGGWESDIAKDDGNVSAMISRLSTPVGVGHADQAVHPKPLLHHNTSTWFEGNLCLCACTAFRPQVIFKKNLYQDTPHHRFHLSNLSR